MDPGWTMSRQLLPSLLRTYGPMALLASIERGEQSVFAGVWAELGVQFVPEMLHVAREGFRIGLLVVAVPRRRRDLDVRDRDGGWPGARPLLPVVCRRRDRRAAAGHALRVRRHARHHVHECRAVRARLRRRDLRARDPARRRAAAPRVAALPEWAVAVQQLRAVARRHDRPRRGRRAARARQERLQAAVLGRLAHRLVGDRRRELAQRHADRRQQDPRASPAHLDTVEIGDTVMLYLEREMRTKRTTQLPSPVRDIAGRRCSSTPAI